MNTFSRDILKEFFSEGRRPTEEQFEALINSTVNILDDGYSKDKTDGLKIAPSIGNNTLMSFCAKSGNSPSWIFAVNHAEDLLIEAKGHASAILNASEKEFHPSLSLNAPKTVIKGDVEVHGIKKGKSVTPQFEPVADGIWYDITEDLYGMYAMEVVAHVEGTAGSGEYAVLMAWTTHCFGSKTIRTIGSHYGFFGRKIRLRWKRNKDNTYKLQIKTRLRYKDGKNLPIHCNITYLQKYERNVLDKTGKGR